MMTLIQQALAVGWSANQILNYLSRKVKGISGSINNSRKSGYSDDDILKFLQGKIKSPKVSEPETAYGKYLKESGVLTKQERDQRKAKGIKTALQAGGTALSAYTAYQSGKQFAPQLQQILGIGQGPIQPTAGPQPTPGVEVGMQRQQAPALAPIAPEQQAPVQQSQEAAPQLGLEASFDAINRSKFGNILANLKQDISGEDAKSLIKNYGGGSLIQDLEKSLGKPFESIFEEYKQVRDAQKTQEAPQEMPSKMPGEGLPTEVEEDTAETEKTPEIQTEGKKPLGKGSTVITKDGRLGTVEDIPGKTAKIVSDGKKSVVETDQLIESPLPEKDLADLWDDLIGGIEKKTGEKISRHVNLAGWDPNSNALLYKPWKGKTYIFKDIPNDLLDILRSEMKRKTSGESLIGAWEEGTESPLGAAMQFVIQTLTKQRGRHTAHAFAFDTIYEALGPAIEEKEKRFNEEKKRQKRKK